MRGQRGFTLVEAMIVVGIMGIIGVVVTNLFTGVIRGWHFNLGHIASQRQARAARDTMVKFVRQASAASVEIGRFHPSQPPLSMLTYHDAAGNSRAFFQHGNRFSVGIWTIVGGVRVASAQQMLMTNYVQRITFYYPDMKDPQKLGFLMHSSWPVPTSKSGDIQTQFSGVIDIRDP